MNKIAVATHMNGTQSLHTLKQIFEIGKGQPEEKRMKMLIQWCFCNRINSLEIRNMDGSLDGWIVKMN